MRKVKIAAGFCIISLFLIFTGIYYARQAVFNNQPYILHENASMESAGLKTEETENNRHTGKEIIPRIIDVIIEEDFYTALCEDGSVWEWDNTEEAEEARKLSGLDNIVKIMDAGDDAPVIYALSEDGSVYAWGIACELESTADREFYEPAKLSGLQDIVELDANNGKAFAIDRSGNFYAWGFTLDLEDSDNKGAVICTDKKKPVTGVKALFAGAGDYSYFMREDGSVFSIMGVDALDDRNDLPYIFPVFKDESYEAAKSYDEIAELLHSGRLNPGSKSRITVACEIGTDKNIEEIGADGYTVFVYKKDNTLWYWQSSRIKYHDDFGAISDPITAIPDYSGYFEQVDIQSILGEKIGVNEPIEITDICAGLENALFLTNDGQVFVSGYKTFETKDVEYYYVGARPGRADNIRVIPDMQLKTLEFQKLELEGIASINTDGKYFFSAVTGDGECYSLDLTPSEEETSDKNNQQMDLESLYHMLNKDILSGYGKQDELKGLDNSTVQKFSEEAKGEFTVIKEGVSLFPADLVSMLEEVIYNNLDNSMQVRTIEEINKSQYIKTLKSLGSDEFELDEEEIKLLFPKTAEKESIWDSYKEISGSENCINIFHFSRKPGEDNYLFAEDSGGSNGAVSIRLSKRVNNEFIDISKFETQNEGYGKVIRYGESFYYIFLQYNYNLKNYDGIRLYKLGENAETENLLIKYLPNHYIWKNIYRKQTDFDLELEDYINNIREDITSAGYIENGSSEDIGIYYGDEKRVEDFALTDSYSQYYSIDFANTGIPVYFKKSNLIPSSYRDTWLLRARFYVIDPADDSAVELNNLEINENNMHQDKPELVQLWFKEIGGKMFTFRLFHTSDYNYMLNVILVEGDQVTQIRNDIFSPQRSFVLTEGERYHTF